MGDWWQAKSFQENRCWNRITDGKCYDYACLKRRCRCDGKPRGRGCLYGAEGLRRLGGGAKLGDGPI